MRAILILTLKDLRRRLADPAGLLLNLAIPLVMAGVMYLAFGGHDKDKDAAPVLRILVLDLDQGPVARAITGSSSNPEAARRLDMKVVQDREEGLRRLREEEFAALLVLPQGFSKALLEGRQVELELLKNPAQSVMPIVAQQITEVLSLYLSIGSRVVGGDGERIRLLFEGEGWADAAGIAALVTSLSDRVINLRRLLLPPLIEVEKTSAGKEAGGFNLIAWLFPGMVMMGLLFTSVSQMGDLLRESQNGTLRRQLTAPLGAGQVVMAKVLSVALLGAIAFCLLVAAGRFGFGVHWGDPAPLAAAGALVVLAATGFAALLFSLVRTERQGDALGGILTMLMSLLGGTFFPIEALPGWLQDLSKLTLSRWGHGALRILANGEGWRAVSGHLAVLAGIALVSTTLGVAFLRRRHLRGAL